MIEIPYKNNNKTVLVFIHGFTGNNDTWKNSKDISFADLLWQNQKFKENIDIAYFSYYSELLDSYVNLKKKASSIKKLFGNNRSKVKKLLSISELSDLLYTDIRFHLKSYENIIIIAHSMGGLVTKSYLIKSINEQRSMPVRLFLSLAVPHNGSNLATFAKVLTNNIQIENLKPLSAEISGMNQEWIRLKSRVKSKYFFGLNDDVVPKTSAIPIEEETQDYISLDEDHISISKPEGIESTTYLAALSFIHELIDYLEKIEEKNTFELSEEDISNDEYFVLKLLIGNVHNNSVEDAKEKFLQAEYIRKIITDPEDLKQLDDLYAKIRDLYLDSYTHYLHNESQNSGQLLAAVYEKIINHDDSYLQSSLLPFIKALEKKGMIHQLANDLKQDIWWTEEQSVEALQAIRDKPE